MDVRYSILGLIICIACGGGCGSTVSTTLQAEPFALVRGDVQTNRPVGVANPFGAEAVVELVEAPTGAFALAKPTFPLVISAGAEREFDVAYAPDGAATAEGEMLLSIVSEGNRRNLRIRFSASVETPRIDLLTPSIAFGDVLVGESATREMRVRNSSAVTPLDFSAITALPADFMLTGGSGTLAPGATASLALRYSPQQLGTHGFSIAVAHDAPGDALSISVTGRSSTWPAEIITDFGTVTLTDDETDWIEVDVPPHAISFSIEALRDGAQIGLLEFQGPVGHVYENDTATGEFLWFTGDEVFTATVPSSDRSALKLVPGGGIYRFRLYLMSGSASSFDVRTIVHNRPGGSSQTGELHINVYLAPGLAIDIADAPTHTRLQAVLTEADRIFAQQGLRIGQVDYYALADAAYDNIGSQGEFGDLCAESSVATETRVNLFFVLKTLSGPVGVAARLAGPARNGTPDSGVMVDFDFGTVAQNGYVTAHEIGHFLGLLHTTESDGGHDLIDDTLECPATGTDATCSVEGGGNLMHWRVRPVDPAISDGQGLVIRGHPLVGPLPPLPSLATLAQTRSSPLLAGALPEGWCGTACCRDK